MVALAVGELGGPDGMQAPLSMFCTLWPWSGRVLQDLTKQGAHPRLAQLQSSGLYRLRPGWYLEWRLRRTCSGWELVDGGTLSEREGWSFGLAWGV